MAILTKEKLATYGIEVLVVVLGILIAFQVDAWREDRQQRRDRNASLIRLAEETTANLRICDFSVGIRAQHALWMQAVVRALNGGQLSDVDAESFNAGLIRVGFVAHAPYSATVAEEMIATGLLKDLANADLRTRIAALPVAIEVASGWEADTRGSLAAAVAEVAKAVDFQYHGDLPAPDDTSEEYTGFEDGISVAYVFEELVGNRNLKNAYIEAADTHLDMWNSHRLLCAQFEEIQSSLSESTLH